jgi:hypothetical protein
MFYLSAGRLDDEKALNILTAREAKTAQFNPGDAPLAFLSSLGLCRIQSSKTCSSPSLVNLIRHDPSSDMICRIRHKTRILTPAHLAQNRSQNQAFEGDCFSHLSRLLDRPTPDFLALSQLEGVRRDVGVGE